MTRAAMFPKPRSSTLSWCTVPATAPGAGSSLRACSRAPPTASPASTPTTSDRSMTTTRRSSSSWRPCRTPTRSWPPYLSYHIYYVKHVFINNLKPWLIQSIICWIYSTRSILNNLHVLMQSIISSLGISKGFYFLSSSPKQVPNCMTKKMEAWPTSCDRQLPIHDRERVDWWQPQEMHGWDERASLLLQWQVDMDLFYRPYVDFINHMFCDFSDPNTCFSSTFLCLLIFRFATAHWSYIISLCFS